MKVKQLLSNLIAFTCNATVYACIIFICTLMPLQAIELDEDVNLRGFGSLYGILNTSEDTRRRLPNGTLDILEKNNVYLKSSFAGLQLDASLTDTIDLMIQGIYIQERDSKTYKPRLEWAMLGYHFGNDYLLRVGNMKISSMDGAQNRYIGYSYLWVFPQVSFNGINGFENFYGVDLSKKGFVGNLDYEWQLNGGKLQNHVSQSDVGKYLYSGALKIYYDNLIVRLGVGQLVFDHYSKDKRLIGKDKEITFASAELQWQYDRFELSGGYNTHLTDAIPETNTQYLSLSYRYDFLSPYLLYTKDRVTNIPLANVPRPPAGIPQIEAPVAGSDTNAEFGNDLEEHFVIGFRYDIFKGIAFKAEYDYMHREAPGDQSKYYNLINATLDMVF